MMRKVICFLCLLPLIFTSCKSKKNLLSSNTFPALIKDSIRPDSSDYAAALFTPDHISHYFHHARHPQSIIGAHIIF